MEPTPANPGKRLLSAAIAATLLAGCVSHYRVHPRQDPPAVSAWSEEVDRGRLRIRLEWVRPAGEGPFAAVMVHPEAGHPAREMRGVLRSLSLAGYLAVAADYQRLRPDGTAEKTLFTWRDPDDPWALLDLVQRRPEVDPERVGAIGFSQGGVYSLLIAAYTQEVRAVVAYYPVTDFEQWLDNPERPWARRQVFKLIRRHLRRQSGALSEAEFAGLLKRASALLYAERLAAPVLLIHGDRDTSAEIVESRRLEERLRELGREVELMEIEGAGHVFNFRDTERAGRAWTATRAWLDRHLAP